jgi:hypothetical protein
MKVAPPKTGPGDRRFSALGFDLHYDNMRLLGEGDIILPSIGGAGSSLLGNVLLELGLNYVDLSKEVLFPDGTSMPPVDSITRRVRTNTATVKSRTLTQQWPRFGKTHLPVEEFDGYPFGGVMILVRDPRDALYSWHQYHLGFAEMEWETVDDSFENFLQQPFFSGPCPIANWRSFYEGWTRRAQRCHYSAVIRFEDLKHNPMLTIRETLAATDVQVPTENLRRAVERSSYEAMRAHENMAAEHDSDRREARVMRSGRVEGWREWMTPQLTSYFSDERLRSVARQFGYIMPTSF